MLKRLALLLILSSTFTGTIATTTGCGSSSGGGGGTGGSGGGGGAGDPDLTCDASPTATTFAKVYSDVITPSCNQTCHKPNVTDGSDSCGRCSRRRRSSPSIFRRWYCVPITPQ